MGSPVNDSGQYTNIQGNANSSLGYAPGTQFYTDPMTGNKQSVYFGEGAQNRLKAQQYLAGQQGIGMTQQFQKDARTAAGQIGTNFQQYVPTLNSNYGQHSPTLQTNFAPQGGLDSWSRGLLSEGQQSIARNLGATQGQIARSVQGPAAQVLQSQATAQARLNANPLLFQVGAQQVGRQQQEAQLSNQAVLAQGQERSRLQGLSNDTLLAQQGANNTALSAGNQANALKLGMQGLPVAAQQNLVSLLQSQREK